MKRIALTFAFFLGFGSLGVQWAAARTLRRHRSALDSRQPRSSVFPDCRSEASCDFRRRVRLLLSRAELRKNLSR